MKIDANTRIKICPRCGNAYHGARTDNHISICPDCGTREALDSLGVSIEEQDEIIATIHRYERNVSFDD